MKRKNVLDRLRLTIASVFLQRKAILIVSQLHFMIIMARQSKKQNMTKSSFNPDFLYQLEYGCPLEPSSCEPE
jgi:hypothetical protein